MSRTRHDERAEKRGYGKDWWGKRPLAGHPVSTRPHTNKWWKRLLHKKERQAYQEDLRQRRLDATRAFYENSPYNSN